MPSRGQAFQHRIHVVRLGGARAEERRSRKKDLAGVSFHTSPVKVAIDTFQRNEVIMISRNVIRRSLQTLAPVMFLLLCSSISAFAESPSKAQKLIRVVFNNYTVKIAVYFVGNIISIRVIFAVCIMDY